MVLNGLAATSQTPLIFEAAGLRQQLAFASAPLRYVSALALSLLISLFGCGTSRQPPSASNQPVLGHRSVNVLHIDNLDFKDLNHNGRLDPYEDWRLSPEVRTADLVGRLKLEELAGLMVHGSLPSFGQLATLGNGNEYDPEKARHMILEQHVSSFITRLSGAASAFAGQNNRIQEIGESSAFGIPITISSDPRHHFQQVLGASDKDATFSLWPEPLGFASLNDPAVTRRFGDVVRREYMAVGIRESLAPQADLATEPRWARTNGTFGEDATIASQMVKAYVTGVQNGGTGLNANSVIVVVKHWAGYGAAKDGWDSHNFYGRFANHESNNFDYHLQPFRGAFEAHAGSVMPTYSVLQGVTIDGQPLEPVGAGFNRQMLQELLRGKYGFRGVILSDWAVTNDCGERCRHGATAGSKPGPADIGMPWGVEDLTQAKRFAKAINAGVDQVGGTERSNFIIDDVNDGSISESRVREAAGRILLQKFQLGLFEQPYADETKAAGVTGNAEFVRDGQEAQAKAVVLLENKSGPGKTARLLPMTAGKKLFLYGVASKAAEAAGFSVVDDPARADIAIVRAPAPYQSEHPNYFFGLRQHEGRLRFNENDGAYKALLRSSRTTPTVFVTTLERPLILTEVKAHAAALLGDFGIADAPLLALLTGKVAPQGHLPFELPSSEAAVRAQKSDLPHDSQHPLYQFGYGLRY